MPVPLAKPLTIFVLAGVRHPAGKTPGTLGFTSHSIFDSLTFQTLHSHHNCHFSGSSVSDDLLAVLKDSLIDIYHRLRISCAGLAQVSVVIRCITFYGFVE